MTITFKAAIDSERPITDVWLKFEIPFQVESLGPALWAGVTTCCDFPTIPFASTEEVYDGYTNGYSKIYVKLPGATYDKDLTYVMQLNPNKWMTKVGYSEAVRLSIISKNVENHITYAYNYAFMTFYGGAIPSNALVMQDETTDPLRLKVNQIIDSFIIVTVGSSSAQRVIIQVIGDYKYTTDANTNCEIIADAAKGITAPDPSDYTCGFFESLGPNKEKFIIFTFLAGSIPAGDYKFKFKL